MFFDSLSNRCDESATLVVLVAEGLDLPVDSAVLLLRQLHEQNEFLLVVMESVGKTSDKLNATVEKRTGRPMF